MEADGNDAGVVHADQFDIAAVALYGGAELANDVGYAVLDVISGLRDRSVP